MIHCPLLRPFGSTIESQLKLFKRAIVILRTEQLVACLFARLCCLQLRLYMPSGVSTRIADFEVATKRNVPRAHLQSLCTELYLLFSFWIA